MLCAESVCFEIPHFVILHLFSLHVCVSVNDEIALQKRNIFFPTQRSNGEICIVTFASSLRCFQVDVNPSAAFRQLTTERVRSAKNLQHQHECFHVQFQISTTCPGSIYIWTMSGHFICKESFFCIIFISVTKTTQRRIQCHNHENGRCLGLSIISHLLF